MRRKILYLLIIITLMASCINRNFDTPADRLVGHWATDVGDNLYYSKADKNGVGRYILVQDDGNTARHQYKIISQIPDGERIVVNLLFASGSQRAETLIISKMKGI